MKLRIVTICCILMLVFCAPYKQLKPQPEISPAEAGYIELKKDEKPFKLKKNKKYFVAFPPAQQDNFYLVLTLSDKDKFSSFLVDSYVKNKLGQKIKDEASTAEKISVYPIGTEAAGRFWMIEDVSQDMELKVQYRYVPQWRYKFETKHAEFKDILKNNTVSRAIYDSIGPSFNFDMFNFAGVIDEINSKSANLEKLNSELLSIENIFPPAIVNSTDKAYLDYVELKRQLQDQIQFQKLYKAVSEFLVAERRTRGDPAGFMRNVKNFIEYFSLKEKLTSAIVKESQLLLEKRIKELIPYYERKMGTKQDASPLDSAGFNLGAFYLLSSLHETAGVQQTDEVAELYRFICDFDKASRAVALLSDSLGQIKKDVADISAFPSDNVFTQIINRVENLKNTIYPKLERNYGKYQQFGCMVSLKEEIQKTQDAIEKALAGYHEAQKLVVQVNSVRTQGMFREAINILRGNQHLSFLLEKYRGLDSLSVKQQNSRIINAMDQFRWSEAEAALKQLYGDEIFLFPSQVYPMRDAMVRVLEDSLYSKIDRMSRARILKFCEEKIGVLENIDSLYNDSAFLPIYDLTFSTGSKKELVQRKNDLIAHLAKMKENEFPAKAINMLFEQFTKNPSDNGVLKARAIVAHGERYKGNDEKIRRKVAECNPWAAKWIVEPKEYRRIYVLPITNNRKGKNRYFFRINIRIPTEAQFPVYDVNIKLPKEIAQNASKAQWYEKITLNDKELRNEGRFTITAPTSENNYECQVTPVSVNKEGNNNLDVYFEYDGFQVFTVSVMVQKPIIKKN